MKRNRIPRDEYINGSRGIEDLKDAFFNITNIMEYKEESIKKM